MKSFGVVWHGLREVRAARRRADEALEAMETAEEVVAAYEGLGAGEKERGPVMIFGL